MGRRAVSTAEPGVEEARLRGREEGPRRHGFVVAAERRGAARAVLLSLAGCGALSGPAPSAAPAPGVPPVCGGLEDRVLPRAGALVEAGAVDEASMVLEDALEACPTARRLDEKRREIEASLGVA